jgi:hypothetical protein
MYKLRLGVLHCHWQWQPERIGRLLAFAADNRVTTHCQWHTKPILQVGSSHYRNGHYKKVTGRYVNRTRDSDSTCTELGGAIASTSSQANRMIFKHTCPVVAKYDSDSETRNLALATKALQPEWTLVQSE